MTDKHDHKPSSPEDQAPQGKPGMIQVAQSVLAAIFGVQSGKNRERDFKKGQASDYIAVYVILVIALVVGMIITVNTVISNAGH
ncbi:MAG: DUF2970 domain-containing protein [Alcanivoracaceae bacterium]|nr:DUF2970 domain-containing protein [Alcanivoracaceae bacterium]